MPQVRAPLLRVNLGLSTGHGGNSFCHHEDDFSLTRDLLLRFQRQLVNLIPSHTALTPSPPLRQRPPYPCGVQPQTLGHAQEQSERIS